ncbi:hypothetical protein T484DRAFT_1575116, partial [Baffinella frigidus]
TSGAFSCTACGTGYSGCQPSCTLCTAGTYSFSWDEHCRTCPEGTWSLAGAGAAGIGFACDWCPAETSSPPGSNELTDCTCLAGYTAASDGVECGACDAGTYKTATGAGDCSACLAGTSSSASGSTELTDCTDCLAGTY